MKRMAWCLLSMIACTQGPAGTCFEQSQEVDQRLSSYVSSAAAGCTVDQDCALADAGLSCHRRCPQAVLADHVSLLGTQLQGLEVEYCSGSSCLTTQGCVPSSPRCALGRCTNGPPLDAGSADGGPDLDAGADAGP